MTFTVTYENEEGEEELIEIPARWEVCGLCNGAGQHINPSIDAHGLSREDFDRDPDFAEDYMNGRFDVPCYRCSGRSTEPVPDMSSCSEVKRKIIEEILDNHQLDIREREAEIKYGY